MAFRNLPEMPCGPILELYGQRKRFHVPYGLKRLLEDMTREVLRYQPENVYEFLADFMDTRLQRKLSEEAKNQRRKSWQQHRWSWQGGSILEPEELKEFLEQLPAPAEQINHHAVVIQSAFRGYQARKKVKQIRQSIHIEDERRKSLLASLAKAEPAEDEDDEERDRRRSALKKRRPTMEITPENVTEEELHSAIIIQSAFRGMHARKEVKKLRASFADPEGRRMSEYQGQEAQEEHPEPISPAENAEQPVEVEEPAPPPEAEAPAIPETEAQAVPVEVEATPPPEQQTEAEPKSVEVPAEENLNATPAKEAEEAKPEEAKQEEVNPEEEKPE